MQGKCSALVTRARVPIIVCWCWRAHLVDAGNGHGRARVGQQCNIDVRGHLLAPHNESKHVIHGGDVRCAGGQGSSTSWLAAPGSLACTSVSSRKPHLRLPGRTLPGAGSARGSGGCGGGVHATGVGACGRAARCSSGLGLRIAAPRFCLTRILLAVHGMNVSSWYVRTGSRRRVGVAREGSCARHAAACRPLSRPAERSRPA